MLYSKEDIIKFKCHPNPGIVLEVMKEYSFYKRFGSNPYLIKWIVFYPERISIVTNRYNIVSHKVYYYVLIGDKQGWITDNMVKE